MKSSRSQVSFFVPSSSPVFLICSFPRLPSSCRTWAPLGSSPQCLLTTPLGLLLVLQPFHVPFRFLFSLPSLLAACSTDTAVEPWRRDIAPLLCSMNFAADAPLLVLPDRGPSAVARPAAVPRSTMTIEDVTEEKTPFPDEPAALLPSARPAVAVLPAPLPVPEPAALAPSAEDESKSGQLAEHKGMAQPAEETPDGLGLAVGASVAPAAKPKVKLRFKDLPKAKPKTDASAPVTATSGSTGAGSGAAPDSTSVAQPAQPQEDEATAMLVGVPPQFQAALKKLRKPSGEQEAPSPSPVPAPKLSRVPSKASAVALQWLDEVGAGGEEKEEAGPALVPSASTSSSSSSASSSEEWWTRRWTTIPVEAPLKGYTVETPFMVRTTLLSSLSFPSVLFLFSSPFSFSSFACPWS